MTDRSVLISTIPNTHGGVAAMVRWVVEELEAAEYEPLVAWYEPYSLTPRLSVPLFRLGRARPGSEPRTVIGSRAGRAVGAWLPELEFTHYLPTRLWADLVGSCAHHLAVSGNVFPVWPLVAHGLPGVAWVATDWMGDRRERVQATYPAVRRFLDRVVVRPVAKRLERRLLRRAHILALSEPTRRELDRRAGGEFVKGVLPHPVDTAAFAPSAGAIAGRVGCSGRMEDPRKNLDLFLQVIAWCREREPSVHGEILGLDQSKLPHQRLAELGLPEGAVECRGYLGKRELPQRLGSLDVLLLTSHQEGLCIAALEAMSSGCPVVSTRCGGPEEYVIDGETGYLGASRPEALGVRVLEIVRDRALRTKLAAGARAIVEEKYSRTRAAEVLWDALGTATEMRRSE